MFAGLIRLVSIAGIMVLGLFGTGPASATDPPPPPKIGDAAPRFILKTPDGTEDLSSGQYRGECPLILLFGSYTAPTFRAHLGDMQQLHTDFKDLAAVRMVYIREAHAADGNDPTPFAVDKGILEHRTDEQRCAMARRLCENEKVEIPCVVDGMDDAACDAYQAYPDRIYLIRKDGRLGVVGDPGPQGFETALARTRAWLEAYRRTGGEPPLDFNPPTTTQPSTQPSGKPVPGLAALVGEWKMVTDLGDEHIEAIMTLKFEKGRVTGVWESRGGQMPLYDIELEGQNLTFRRILAGRRLDFEGTFDGQTIVGAYKTRLGALPCTGTRRNPPPQPAKQSDAATSQPAAEPGQPQR